MLTKSKLVAAVHAVRTVSRRWDEELIQLPKPTEEARELVRSALRDMCEEIDTDDVEPEAREMVLLADDVASCFHEWNAQYQVRRDSVNVRLWDDIWSAFNKLLVEVDRPEKRKLESVKQLSDQGLTSKQIAKLYGWYRDLGDGQREPDIAKVQEELKNPGTHQPMPNPRELERQRDVELRWACRKPERARKSFEHQRTEVQPQARATKQPPPESVETLLRQGVSVRQISKMHQLTEDEVLSQAREMRIIPAELDQRTDLQKKQAHDEELFRILKVDSHPEFGDDRQQRILHIFADGHDVATVAKVLQRSGFPEVSCDVVRSTLIDAGAIEAETTSTSPA